jgi:hemolysin activation/secretion protein
MSFFAIAHAANSGSLTFMVSEIEVTGENPLDGTLIQSTLSPYLGEHQGLDKLVDAAKALEQELANQGYTFHRVVLPEQTLEAGKVTLQVIAFKVGQVQVSGNQHFSRENILKSLPAITPGEIPNTERFSRALRVANLHNDKEYDLKIKQGIEADTIDAEVKVKDSKPWTFFTGLNNTGSDETGDYRLTFAGQYSNLFDLDHSIAVSYTTSPGHYGDVQQSGFNYQLPLYRYFSQLNFFYTESDVDSGQIGDFDVSGAGRFYGLNLAYYLPSVDRYDHQINIGMQDHYFTNESLFFGTNLGTDVRSRPFNVDYLGEYKSDRYNAKFYISALINDTSGKDNTKLAYRAVRFDADHHWSAIRFAGSINYFMEKQWLLRGRLNGQWSDDVLIPGEQFGLGGHASVRGFEERAVSADSGLFASAELWTPPIRKLKNLRILGFIDFGYRDVNEISVPGERHHDTIASVGAGIRWQWKDAFNLSLDYGYVVDEADQASTTADEGDDRFHLNLSYRF